jgi:hypothetical protein
MRHPTAASSPGVVAHASRLMPQRWHALQPPLTQLSVPERRAASAIDWACARSWVRPSDIGSISPAASTLHRKRPVSAAPVFRMTALAPFLGSTMRWALGLTFVQVNTTEASRGAGLRSDGIVDADRSCLFNRCSARSITIVSRSPVCAPTAIYSERDKFFLKLRVNPTTFSVNRRQR